MPESINETLIKTYYQLEMWFDGRSHRGFPFKNDSVLITVVN